MREPVYVSPTQVQAWRLCRRKAAFIYNEGRRPPSTEGQEFGTRGHALGADWLATGATPADKSSPEWAAFSRGIRPDLLPPPGPENKIEHEFKLAVDGGEIHLVGFIDCYRPGKRALVVDHKFVSDVRYALTASELATDAQGVMYSGVALFYGAEEAEARWVYYPKRGRAKPVRVSVTFTEESIRPEWERLLADVRAWVAVRRAKTPALELEPNALACGAYGGCPFRKDCGLTTGQKLAARLHQFDRAHGKKGLPILSGPDTIEQRTKETSTMNLAEKLAAMKQGKTAKPNGAPPPGPPPAAAKAKKPTEKPTARGVNPPEKDAPAPAEAKPKHDGLYCVELRCGVPVPKGEGKLCAKHREPESAPAAAPAERPPKAAPAVKPEPGARPGKLTVYIDCVPMKGVRRTVHLVELLAPVMRAVAEKAKVAHWSLAEYGSGPGLLARALDDAMRSSPMPGSVALVVDGSTAEARAVKEVLLARADVVVKGLRG